MLIDRYLKLIALEFAVLIASLSCQSTAQTPHWTAAAGKVVQIDPLKFPEPWLEQTAIGLRPIEGMEQIEVRQVPNGLTSEFFFGALPNGAFDYAHELNPNIPKPEYSQNFFAVDFSDRIRTRTVSNEEWSNASRILTDSRLVGPLSSDLMSGEIKYRGKTFQKTGKYWGRGLLSPHGKWLAVFSYSGEKPPPNLLHFITGGNPRTGDIFWQVYDAESGQKVFEWEAKDIKNPASLDTNAIWLEERRLLFPLDVSAQNFNVVTLPEFVPSANPATVRFPSRKDPNGVRIPPGDSHEVWGPLVALTKEQAAELTAPKPTELCGVRLSAQPYPRELLIGIREETANERRFSRKRDGAGEYHYSVSGEYYYAVSLGETTQTRFASKEEWQRGRVLQTSHTPLSLTETVPTTWGDRPQYHPIAKTGNTWANPKALRAGDWIAAFSYTRISVNSGEIFIDVYESRAGNKMSSAKSTYEGSLDALLENAVWVEGDYLIIPLNSTLDSFLLWTLPG